MTISFTNPNVMSAVAGFGVSALDLDTMVPLPRAITWSVSGGVANGFSRGFPPPMDQQLAMAMFAGYSGGFLAQMLIGYR